jgi:hypothetical protein
VANAPREEAPSLVFKNNVANKFSMHHVFTRMPLYTPVGWIKFRGDEYGAWTDFSCDGFMDLTVFSSTNGGEISLYQNLEKEGFSLKYKFFSTAFAWADFNNDGFQDLLLANVANKVQEERPVYPHQILLNDGGGNFMKRAYIDSKNMLARAFALGDFDNDGDVDIYIQNSVKNNMHKQPGEKNILYQNNGNLDFEDVINTVSGKDFLAEIGGNMATWVDFDNDGDLDLFIAAGEMKSYWKNLLGKSPLDNSIKLLQNSGNSNNWLKIKLKGLISNKEGIGGRIFFKTSRGLQYREVNHGSSGFAQESLPVHFGVGDSQVVDWIKIRWPSNLTQVEYGVKVNQTLIITEEAE